MKGGLTIHHNDGQMITLPVSNHQDDYITILKELEQAEKNRDADNTSAQD